MENKQTNNTVNHASQIELASAVADRVQIRDVRLIHCACHQTPKAAQAKKFNARLNRRPRVEVDPANNSIAVIAHFEFVGNDAQAEDKEPAFHIAADFLVLYAANSLDGLGDDNYKNFAHLNGIYNAWPYWREFLHNTMSRMELKPFLLPVFRIAGPPEPPKTAHATDGNHSSPPTE